MKKLMIIAIVCILALLFCSAVKAEYYKIIDLGTICPTAINDANYIGGASSFNWDSNPILRAPNGSVTILSNSWGSVNALNNNNWAAGTVFGDSEGQHGFLFDGNAFINIGGTNAQDVNASGNVAGCNNNKAMVWNYLTRQWTDVGAGEDSILTAINDFDISAGYRGYDVMADSFVADGSGGISTINCSKNDRANDINNGGNVIISGDVDGFIHQSAAPYSSTQDILSYGMYAESIRENESGYTVGFFDTGFEGPHAFMYTPGGFMQDLNMLVNIDLGWLLAIATDINKQGVIVGQGFNKNHELHGFALMPQSGAPVPEPGTLTLLFMGVGSMIVARRKRTL